MTFESIIVWGLTCNWLYHLSICTNFITIKEITILFSVRESQFLLAEVKSWRCFSISQRSFIYLNFCQCWVRSPNPCNGNYEFLNFRGICSSNESNLRGVNFRSFFRCGFFDLLLARKWKCKYQFFNPTKCAQIDKWFKNLLKSQRCEFSNENFYSIIIYS